MGVWNSRRSPSPWRSPSPSLGRAPYAYIFESLLYGFPLCLPLTAEYMPDGRQRGPHTQEMGGYSLSRLGWEFRVEGLGFRV